jgi:hypothetical protein
MRPRDFDLAVTTKALFSSEIHHVSGQRRRAITGNYSESK